MTPSESQADAPHPDTAAYMQRRQYDKIYLQPSMTCRDRPGWSRYPGQSRFRCASACNKPSALASSHQDNDNRLEALAVRAVDALLEQLEHVLDDLDVSVHDH